MSAELYLMKNLVDMGVIDKPKDNTIESSYKTQDGNYIINMIRKRRLSFLSEDSTSSYYCSINFLTSLEVPILSIQTTEIEISRLLDVFYNLLECNIGSEAYFYFNPNTSECIPHMFSLQENDNIPLYTNTRYIENYIFSVYDKLDDILNLRFSIPFTHQCMFEFLEMMYYTFLLDIPMETIETY